MQKKRRKIMHTRIIYYNLNLNDVIKTYNEHNSSRNKNKIVW